MPANISQQIQGVANASESGQPVFNEPTPSKEGSKDGQLGLRESGRGNAANRPTAHFKQRSFNQSLNQSILLEEIKQAEQKGETDAVNLKQIFTRFDEEDAENASEHEGGGNLFLGASPPPSKFY